MCRQRLRSTLSGRYICRRSNSCRLSGNFSDFVRRSFRRRAGKVARSCSRRIAHNFEALDDDNVSINTRHSDIGSRCPKSTRGFKEVVVLSGGRLPSTPTVRADLNLRNTLVGIDNLNAEPIRRDTRLVVQYERGSDAAWDVVPADRDDAFRRICEC